MTAEDAEKQEEEYFEKLIQEEREKRAEIAEENGEKKDSSHHPVETRVGLDTGSDVGAAVLARPTGTDRHVLLPPLNTEFNSIL